MADWVYVDNSNVFIEGKRVSAITKGLALDVFDAMAHRIIDNEYRLDFGKLFSFITDGKPARAMLFGSRPPENDAIWDIARRVGFEVVTEDRNASNKEKKIDTGIATQITRDAYKNAKAGDVFTLVSGDADYVPTVRQLIEDGFTVDVVFWNHAARELKEVCSKFVSLDDHLIHLSR